MVILRIATADLTPAGRRLIAHARGQNRLLNQLLTEHAGIVYITLDAHGSPEEFRVTAVQAGVDRDPQEWRLGRQLVANAKRNPEAGAAIINAAAEDFRSWCEAEGRWPWIDPDWIPQVEAVRIVGVRPSTIFEAKRTGALESWDDPAENNPRKSGRVRRSEVLAAWPPKDGAKTPE